MMKPIEILIAEHRVIEQGLQCLARIVDRCEAEGKLDTESARQAIAFFRTFADRCHHGKEEARLFPVLEAHGFSGGCGPVALMLREHELGRLYVQNMEALVEAAGAGDAEAVKWFVQHGRSYVRLLQEHIAKEDRCLFPSADRHLDLREERELTAAFERFEAEEMGRGAHREHLELVNRLADRFAVPRAG